MSTQPLTASGEKTSILLRLPCREEKTPGPLATPSAVAVRREHYVDEAYVRAMGIVNYAYALLFGAQFVADASYPILHAMRRIDSPWSVRPYWSLILGLNARS